MCTGGPKPNKSDNSKPFVYNPNNPVYKRIAERNKGKPVADDTYYATDDEREAARSREMSGLTTSSGNKTKSTGTKIFKADDATTLKKLTEAEKARQAQRDKSKNKNGRSGTNRSSTSSSGSNNANTSYSGLLGG